MRFARKAEIVHVPLEHRTRQDLLELVESTWSRLEKAEIISTPPVTINPSPDRAGPY